jgi:membrane-associated phospholipid phosphatase
MLELNLRLFQYMAAGITPNHLLLPLASIIAVDGSWISVGLLGWAAWRHRSERGYVFATLIACAVAATVAHSIAASLNWPRPFMLGLSPAYIEHGDRGSLPSAHATVMFTIALAFLLRQSLWRLGLLLMVSAALTGWARVYVGVHFPIDIVAGLLLAASIVGLLYVVIGLSRRYLVPLISLKAKVEITSGLLETHVVTPLPRKP